MFFNNNVLIHDQTLGKFTLETVTYTQCYPEGMKQDCEFVKEYITKEVPAKIRTVSLKCKHSR